MECGEIDHTTLRTSGHGEGHSLLWMHILHNHSSVLLYAIYWLLLWRMLAVCSVERIYRLRWSGGVSTAWQGKHVLYVLA